MMKIALEAVTAENRLVQIEMLDQMRLMNKHFKDMNQQIREKDRKIKKLVEKPTKLYATAVRACTHKSTNIFTQPHSNDIYSPVLSGLSETLRPPPPLKV